MTDILISLRDETYRTFMLRLLPTVDPASVIGVKMPRLRALAKGIPPTERAAFLSSLPHRYYEENMLHVCLLGEMRDPVAAVAAVDRFLPFVDNWAVCDSLRPRCFASAHTLLLPHALRWMASAHPYTCRFGMEMLMVHFLGEHFSPALPRAVAAVRSEEYYVNMMIAWYFATALAAHPEEILPYFAEGVLSPTTRRWAIRKAIESDRIPYERKEELKKKKGQGLH